MEAPEQITSKRKRSRPSDYWIVGNDATKQDEDASLDARGGVKERENSAGQAASVRDVSGELEVEVAGGGGRRTRSSGTGAELMVGAVNAKKSIPLADKTNRSQGNGMTRRLGKAVQSSGPDGLDPLTPVEVKKRGRPSRSKSMPAEPAIQEAPKKRGRPALIRTATADELAPEGDGVEISGAGSRKRKLDQGVHGSSKTGSQASAFGDRIQRRRSARMSDAQLLKNVAATTGEGGGTSSKPAIPTTNKLSEVPKRARETVIGVETASSKLQRGRPKSSTTSRNVSQPEVFKVSSAPRTHSKAESSRKAVKTSSAPRTNSKAESARKDSGLASTASRNDAKILGLSKGQGRKRKEMEADEPEEPSKRQRIEVEAQQDNQLPERTPYPHLEPTTRRVSRLKIEKWEPLPPGCVDQIFTLLHELQKPVIARIKDGRKKTQVSVALKSVSKKLVKKLSRGLPFPLASGRTREDDFEFEKILDVSRALESQLIPAIHANELLEAELRKEMARLESDEQNLADLEANAKSEAALRNDTSRSIHPLLHGDDSYEADTFQEDIGLEDMQVHQSLDTSITDKNLQILLKNLAGHMDSIQGNIKQVDGISETLARAKGAVQARLFDHLDISQYEILVLGSDV